MVAREEWGWGSWVKRGRGSQVKLVVTGLSQESKVRQGTRVNNILIMVHGSIWVPETSGEHFVNYDCLTTMPVYLKLVQNNMEYK